VGIVLIEIDPQKGLSDECQVLLLLLDPVQIIKIKPDIYTAP